MDVLKFKSNKTGTGSYVMLVLSMLVLLTAPASAFARDDNAVATLRQIGRIFAEIAEKASPAVVVLTVDKPIPRGQLGTEERRIVGSGGRQPALPSELPDNYRPIRPDPPYPRPRPTRIQPLGLKSRSLGFIVSDDGHILTCNHIVDGAGKVNVKLADGREFEAQVVGTDPETDIAVLKIDTNNLPVLKLSDSDALEVGDWVVGIGNAMGVGRTFAAGLVTAKSIGLGLAALEDLVQTSINLQIGDGGGPLLDLDGNVVGINVATIGDGSGTGINFAIPAGMAKGIYEQLIKTGTIERGFLGIALKDVNAETAKALGLETTEGVIIMNVVKDSAAEKAGIRKYDILVEFNSEPIESASRLIIRVATLKPGTQAELVILREGQRQNLTVTLGKRQSMQSRTQDDVLDAP
jgi:serine protease Do